MPKPHLRLTVWRRSIQLVKNVYSLTAQLPANEKLGLVQQMRRSAVSIPSNIAEGAARGSQKEFNRFLSISQGSIAELETQLIICEELSLVGEAQAKPLLHELEEISRMVIGLQRSLQSTQ